MNEHPDSPVVPRSAVSTVTGTAVASQSVLGGPINLAGSQASQAEPWRAVGTGHLASLPEAPATSPPTPVVFSAPPTAAQHGAPVVRPPPAVQQPALVQTTRLSEPVATQMLTPAMPPRLFAAPATVVREQSAPPRCRGIAPPALLHADLGPPRSLSPLPRAPTPVGSAAGVVCCTASVPTGQAVAPPLVEIPMATVQITGPDLDRDGIPDILQQGAAARGGVGSTRNLEP
ncbi:unnamed protein product, partial [Prorocentrum cordatum]